MSPGMNPLAPSRPATRRRPLRRPPRGNSIVLVLILLTVMLVGALAMARIAEVSTLAGGNAASSDAAMQASEVGLNTGFAAVRWLLKYIATHTFAPFAWYRIGLGAALLLGLPAGG